AAQPDDPDALHILGCILSQGPMRAEGLALIDRSLERSPRNAAFLNNRARVLLESGRAEEALRDARSAVQLEPAFYAAFCQLGGILRALERLEEATAAFRRAAAIAPSGPEAPAALGNVLPSPGSPLLERGDFAGAQ